MVPRRRVLFLLSPKITTALHLSKSDQWHDLSWRTLWAARNYGSIFDFTWVSLAGNRLPVGRETKNHCQLNSRSIKTRVTVSRHCNSPLRSSLAKQMYEFSPRLFLDFRNRKSPHKPGFGSGVSPAQSHNALEHLAWAHYRCRGVVFTVRDSVGWKNRA